MDKIHDSKILNYQVNFEYLILEINVENEQNEQIKIIFEDFFVFHFEDQLSKSILLDIVEEDVDMFCRENKVLLEKGKNYYWPIDYDNFKEVDNHLKNNNYRYFKIQSSYGLNGWVLAKKLSL